jgi:hypothetical protein
MALRLSTGLRNALLSKKAEAENLLTATTISFGDGTGSGSRDQILDSGDGLAGFEKRKKITVSGSAGGTNDGTFEILSVAAGSIEVPAGSFSSESAGEQIILASADGGSISDLFRNGVLDIYAGPQPSDADTGEAGTKLVSITLSSGAFVADAAANGINFDETSSGVLSKNADEVWSGEGLDDGTAGWFRLYDNSYTTGSSASAIRLDGSVATSGAQLNLSNTSISTGGTTTVDTAELTMPAS